MFKVGDQVRCVDDIGYGYLDKSRVYDVIHLIGSDKIYINNDCPQYPYDSTLFVKVNEMTTEKQPTVINGKAKPKGKPVANTYYVRRVGGGSPKVVHMTFEAARNEANRLAELTPDAEFQVLAVAYTVKKVPVYTTESTEYSV